MKRPRYFYDAFKMKNFQANSILEISDAGASLIPIFPKGTTKGWDGRGPYHLSNPKEVIASSKREHVDIVIDRDHQMDLAAPGTPIKAAGWIKELVEQDGAIFARVEWTPAAKAELDNKEYRYISPTFTHDKVGNVKSIIRATLTNHPNFDMRAVASAAIDDENDDTTHLKQPKETTDMNKTLIAIAAVLGLTGAIENEDAILAKVQETVNMLSASSASLSSVAKALELDEAAKVDVIVSTAASLKAAGISQVNKDEFVPMAMYKETASALSSIQSERASEKAKNSVDEAIKGGKITPANKDWAMEYASSNPEGFAKFVESAPIVVAPGAADNSGKKITASDKMDEDDVALCASLGITPDDFKKSRAA